MQTSGLECDMQEDFAQSVADTLCGCRQEPLVAAEHKETVQTAYTAGPCMQVTRWVCAAHNLASDRVPAVVPQQSWVGKGQTAQGAMPLLLAEGAPGLRLRLERHCMVPPAAKPLHGVDPRLRGWLLHPGLGLLQVAVPRLPKGFPCSLHLHLLQGNLPPLPALLRVAPLGVGSHDVMVQLLPPAVWQLGPRLARRCRPLGRHPLPIYKQHGQAMTEPWQTASLSLLLLRQAGGQLGALGVRCLHGRWGVTVCLEAWQGATLHALATGVHRAGHGGGRWHCALVGHSLSRRCLHRLRAAWGWRPCWAQLVGGRQCR